MATSDYQQRHAISKFHQYPRFGHSNRLATLVTWTSNESASNDSLAQQDYIEGIISFSVFLGILFSVWFLVLIVLKLNYGVDRVGCAAGGQIMDVGALRLAKVCRAERKRRILRAWRTQSLFLLASLLLPTFSFLLVNNGLDPFIASLQSLVDVNNQVDAKAFRGIQIADSITALYNDMKVIPNFDVHSFCPNVNANTNTNALSTVLLTSSGMYTLPETFKAGLEMVDSFVKEYLTDIRPGLVQVTDATRLIDQSIDSVYDSDWILKLFLVALNVVNGFFIFGVFLSKISVVYSAFQAMMSYLMIPLFCLALIGSIAATCAAVSMALANADLCAGGPLPGSPLGTIRDTVVEYGYPEGSLPYRSVAYYSQGCPEENPLAFVADFESHVGRTSEIVNAILSNFQAYNITELSEACGTDVQPVNNSLHLLAPTLDSLYGNARAATRLTDCSSIEPVLRQLAQGSTCSDSIDGLAWLFASLLVISVLGMIILSTRAALFNPVIEVKRKKRREKEFEEYKEYMAQFYDTGMWKLDADKKPFDGLRVSLHHAETFETEETSTTSSPRDSTSATSSPRDSPREVENEPVFVEATAIGSVDRESVRVVEATAIGPVGRESYRVTEEEDDDDDYYSDSSSDDEDLVSDSGSKSTITNLSLLLGRFLAFKDDPLDGVSFAHPSNRDSLYSHGWNDQELPASVKSPQESSPSFATPRRRHRALLNNGNGIFRSPDHHHIPEDELQPLTPSTDEDRQPKAPQKGLKHLRRTNGAAKLC